ncbi:MAG: hypothetical protein WAO20_04565 [Acidobacteriota bacterium]
MNMRSLVTLTCLTCLTCLAAAPGGAPQGSPDASGSTAAIYVDCRSGADTNPGTRESPVQTVARAAAILRSPDNAIYVMRLNPGIHVLPRHVELATEKNMAGKRIVVEASVLPDDSKWTPESMPIVISSAELGDLAADSPSLVVGFLVNESHVTIRGIKFHGYPRPNSRYFPVGRFNVAKTDLRVEQCLFLGDPNAAHLQVGVIGHGDGIQVDHCVFYNVRNAVVFWQSNRPKSGNSLTHCIISGARQSAVWTAWPDQDFKFKNNIVTGCKFVWIKNGDNTSKYSIEDSIVVGNEFEMGVSRNDTVAPEAFGLRESGVVKSGKVALRLVDQLDQPLPHDYLQVLPGSAGYEMDAGLFKK